MINKIFEKSKSLFDIYITQPIADPLNSYLSQKMSKSELIIGTLSILILLRLLIAIYKSLKTDNVITLFYKGLERIPILSIIPMLVARHIRNHCIEVAGNSLFTTPDEFDVRMESGLPSDGLKPKDVNQRMRQHFEAEKSRFNSGKLSGAMYFAENEITEVTRQAMKEFTFTDPSCPEAYPSLIQMEAEIISMTKGLFSADNNVCGITTTGGTDSIGNAILMYKNLALKTKGITRPNIITVQSTHLAFGRACTNWGLDIIEIPMIDLKYDLEKVKASINKNTICIVVTACDYSWGQMEPVEEVCALALEHDIACHVDCCLGGYFFPFMKEAHPETDVRPFDFSVEGATTISIDTHKYGYGPKGLSVLLFKTKELATYVQYTDLWEGGIYTQNAVHSSRSGGIIAGTWATLLRIGHNGYVESVREIESNVRALREKLEKIPEIELLGPSKYNIVSIRAREFSSHAISENLSKKGYQLPPTSQPIAMHICFTHANADKTEDFLADLKEFLEKVKQNPRLGKSESAALYGASAKLSDKSILLKQMNIYIDCTLSINLERATYGQS